MKAFHNRSLRWLAALSLGAGAMLVAVLLDVSFSTRPRDIAGAVVIAALAIGAVRLVFRARAPRHANVIQRGPESSTLAFPPSSFRK